MYTHSSSRVRFFCCAKGPGLKDLKSTHITIWADFKSLQSRDFGAQKKPILELEWVYKALVAGFLMLSPVASCFADQLPPYVQVQVDNLNQEVAQLKTQRDQLMNQMSALQNSNDPNASFGKSQLQAQIDRLNSQIDNVQKQIQALQKGS